VICMPDTGAPIRGLLAERAAPQRLLWAIDMEAAVHLAYENTPASGICLLSPTASSYNQYKNFEEKGDEFQRLVQSERGPA
jgi:UDP-N-acetylmuramoylalanine-D-glutamate ligase